MQSFVKYSQKKCNKYCPQKQTKQFKTYQQKIWKPKVAKNGTNKKWSFTV